MSAAPSGLPAAPVAVAGRSSARSSHGIAVVGASGGAGSSTLVAALCLAGARSGRSCVAVDLQPGGGGLDVVFGIEHATGLRWSDLGEVEGAVDGAALGRGLPAVSGVAVLAHPRQGRAGPKAEVVHAAIRGLTSAFDLVVLDTPRADAAWIGEFGAALGTVVVLGRVGVLELAAVAATVASVGTGLTEAPGAPVLLLRGPAPRAGLRRVPPSRRRLCAGVAKDLGIPEVRWLGEDASVRRDVVAGRVPGGRPGAVSRLASEILQLWAATGAPP